MLGKLEEWILLAAVQGGDQLPPSEIYSRMEVRGSAERPPAFGAVYTTLGRMAAKGLLVEHSKQDATGRARRYFTVTGEGRSALSAAMNRIELLGGFKWAGGFNA